MSDVAAGNADLYQLCVRDCVHWQL